MNPRFFQVLCQAASDAESASSPTNSPSGKPSLSAPPSRKFSLAAKEPSMAASAFSRVNLQPKQSSVIPGLLTRPAISKSSSLTPKVEYAKDSLSPTSSNSALKTSSPSQSTPLPQPPPLPPMFPSNYMLVPISSSADLAAIQATLYSSMMKGVPPMTSASSPAMSSSAASYPPAASIVASDPAYLPRGRRPQGNFRCSLCGQCFKTRFSCRRHHKRHIGMKPFACPTCKRPFAEKSTMKRHIQKLHPDVDVSSMDLEPTKVFKSDIPVQIIK